MIDCTSRLLFGINIKSCIEEGLTEPWCSTETSSDGSHVTGQGNYGACSQDCQIDGEENEETQIDGGENEETQSRVEKKVCVTAYGSTTGMSFFTWIFSLFACLSG